MLSAPHAITAEGVGRLEDDGTLVLTQTVEETGQPTRQRIWRIREDRPGHCVGTVSDGDGPVEGEVSHTGFHLRFALKGGLKAEQWLTLQPDGMTARNHLTIRKFGMKVASLDETIRKMGAAIASSRLPSSAPARQ